MKNFTGKVTNVDNKINAVFDKETGKRLKNELLEIS